MIVNYNLLWNEEEYKAMLYYKGYGYNQINILLSNYLTARELVGKGPKTLEQFQNNLSQAILVYMAIKKNYLINGQKAYNKVLFRGTRNDRIETTFLSSTDNLEIALEFAHYEDNSRLLILDLANVPWVDVDKVIYDDDVDDEHEVLILPSQIEKLESLTLPECFEIAKCNGQVISSEQETRLVSENEGINCYKTKLVEIDYSQRQESISIDELMNLFKQYLNDLQIIRSDSFSTINSTDKIEIDKSIERVKQFKKIVVVYLQQIFYKINQYMDYSSNIEKDCINLSNNFDMQEVFVGNTGRLFLIKDKDDGREYYYKPAMSKNGSYKIYRAYIQEAAYRIQQIINPDNAVKCNTINLNGIFGSIQEKISIDQQATNNFIKFFEEDVGNLPEKIINQIIDEYLVDFCLCNYDSHCRNFIIDINGRLRGIDKEQSFRYINDDSSMDMLFSVNYNEIYGESPSIYNILFNKMKKGEISYEILNKLKYRASRLAQYPDEQYKNIFEEYAFNKSKSPKEAEILLDNILERKKNILKNVKELYDKIYYEFNQKKNSL